MIGIVLTIIATLWLGALVVGVVWGVVEVAGLFILRAFWVLMAVGFVASLLAK